MADSTQAHMHVPLIDLLGQHAALRQQVLERLARVYDSGRYILGPEVQAFEARAAQLLGAEHAVGVSNGTDALVCALAALDIGRGDSVLTTPFSFLATASACLRTGADLKFADIDPVDFNLAQGNLDGGMGALRAIVAVHLFGHPADVSALAAAASQGTQGTCAVIEDAAQAFGARLRGASVGTLGVLAAFSFFPGKPLGALGDAGLVTTQDAQLAAKVRALRTHGRGPDGTSQWLGGNYRLDELQAAVLGVKLEHDAVRRAARTAHASAYAERLQGVAEVVTPRARPDVQHAWSVFALRVLDKRDALRAELARRGVETAIYYARPLHLEPALSHLGYARGDFPVAETCSEQLLALPVFAELRPEQLVHVCRCIAEFYGHAHRD